MATAMILTAENGGLVTEFDPSESLTFLQGAVGGLIEHLPFPVEGVDAWINEEGKYSDLQLNPVATVLMRNGNLIFPDDYIVGDLVLTASNDEGETLGLTGEQVDAIVNLVMGLFSSTTTN